MKISEMINSHLNLQNGDSILFLVRHAEKCSSNGLSTSSEVAITSEGIERTKQLGDYLSLQIGKDFTIKTSPIKRCFETAKIFAQRFSKEESLILQSKILGDPGPYVIDRKVAAEAFEKENDNIYIIIQSHIREHIIPGFRDIRDGTALMLKEMIADLSHTKSTMYVSHDAIIAVFLGNFIEDIQFSEENKIEFLDGIAIKKTIFNNYFLYWNGQCFDITNRCEQYVENKVASCKLSLGL